MVSSSSFSLNVDLERYMGTWYEIARYENNFQKNCLETKVEYTLSKNQNFVKVKNICKRKNGKKKLQVARGRAFVTDKRTNSKLKVSFVPFFKKFGLFAGPYWIIALGKDYEYALVGHPEKKFLWILSRTPKFSKFQYLKAFTDARKAGYDVSRLKLSPVWQD